MYSAALASSGSAATLNGGLIACRVPADYLIVAGVSNWGAWALGAGVALLRDGRQWGLSLDYAVQPKPEGLAQALLIGAEFLSNAPCALILGDNLFHGNDLAKAFSDANKRRTGATIFGYHVANPSLYGVVEFARDGRVISLEEKPQRPKSNFAVPGIYFYDGQVVKYARRLKPSARGELEITDLNRLYLKEGLLHAEILRRGIAWLDTGTHASLLEAAEFVHVIENRQGLKIACLEEIAWRQGWIDDARLESNIAKLGDSGYAQYLRRLLTGQ